MNLGPHTIKALASGVILLLAACAPDPAIEKARSFLLSVEPGMKQDDVGRAFLKVYPETLGQSTTYVVRDKLDRRYAASIPYKIPTVGHIDANSFRAFCLEDRACSLTNLESANTLEDRGGKPNYLEQKFLTLNFIGRVGVHVSVLYDPVTMEVIGVIHKGVSVNWPQ